LNTKIREIFYNKVGINCSLSNQELNLIRKSELGTFKNLELYELCKKLTNQIYEFEIYNYDMIYQIKTKNKILDRKQKIIFIGSKKTYEYLNYNINDEYFLDITYKIIPPKFLKYKMMTILCLNKQNNTTKICCFIALKYTDTNSYKNIFQYLKNNFHFNPKIAHIDYENSLRLALEAKNIFNKKPLIIYCFFHFIKSIRERLRKINFCNRKLNKLSLEIIKNIEVICFINKDKVKSFQDFLLNKLNKYENIKGLINLLENFWFKKPINLYNYSKLSHENNHLDINNKYMKRFYFTNNVAESIHQKLDYYLPKRKTTPLDFIESVRNCFINFDIKNTEMERFDIKTRTIISIINGEKLNEKFKWISLDDYKRYLKNIINENKGLSNEIEVNKYITLVEDMDPKENNITLKKEYETIENEQENIIVDSQDDNKDNLNYNELSDGEDKFSKEENISIENTSYLNEINAEEDYKKVVNSIGDLQIEEVKTHKNENNNFGLDKDLLKNKLDDQIISDNKRTICNNEKNILNPKNMSEEEEDQFLIRL